MTITITPDNFHKNLFTIYCKERNKYLDIGIYPNSFNEAEINNLIGEKNFIKWKLGETDTFTVTHVAIYNLTKDPSYYQPSKVHLYK